MNCNLAARVVNYIRKDTAIEDFDVHCKETMELYEREYFLTDTDKYDSTSLHKAIECKNLTLAEHIIKKCPLTMKDVVFKPGINGIPIYHALIDGDYNVLKLLLKYNSPLDLTKISFCDYDYPRFENKERAFKLMLRHSIDLELEAGKEYIFLDNEIKEFGFTFNSFELRTEAVRTITKKYMEEIWLQNRVLEHSILPQDVQNEIKIWLFEFV